MISGSGAVGGEKFSKEKAYMSSMYNFNLESKKLRTRQVITFSYKDLTGIHIPHDDSLICNHCHMR